AAVASAMTSRDFGQASSMAAAAATISAAHAPHATAALGDRPKCQVAIRPAHFWTRSGLNGFRAMPPSMLGPGRHACSRLLANAYADYEICRFGEGEKNDAAARCGGGVRPL